MTILRPAILLFVGFIAPTAWGAHSADLRNASRELDHAADAFYQTLQHRLGSGALLTEAEYFADGAYEFAVRVDSYENSAVLWDDFQRLVDRFDHLAREFHADSYAADQNHVADDFYTVEVAMDRIGNAFRLMPRYRQTFNYTYSQWPWHQHRFWTHYYHVAPVRYYQPSIYVHNYYSSGTRRTHIARFQRRNQHQSPRHRDRQFPPPRLGPGNARNDRHGPDNRNNRRHANVVRQTHGRTDRQGRRANNDRQRDAGANPADRNNSRRDENRRNPSNDVRRTRSANNPGAARLDRDASRSNRQRSPSSLAPPANTNARNSTRRQAPTRNTAQPRSAAPAANHARNQRLARSVQPTRPQVAPSAATPRRRQQTRSHTAPPAPRNSAHSNRSTSRSSSDKRSSASSNAPRSAPRSAPTGRRNSTDNGNSRSRERR